MGRPKASRDTTAAVAEAVLKKAKVEEKWLRIIEIATAKAEDKQQTADLRATLIYLENRAFGDTVHHVNYAHTDPIKLEGNLTLSISAELREARERATKR